MSINDKLDKAKKKIGETAQKGKEKLQQGKEAVYRTVAQVQDKIEKREGVIGQIADVVDDVVETGKQADADIKAQGGYKKVFGDAAKTGVEAIQSGVEKGIEALKGKSNELYKKGSDLYQKLSKEVESGEGAMDMEKVKAFLKDGARATAHFGAKAVKGLTEIVNQGVKDLKKDYRTVIPTAEERSTKYAGIGTDYQGVLLRQNFEDCLKFYEETRKKLPGGLKGRTDILNYIKASASSNPKELSDFCEKKYYEARKEHGDHSPEEKFESRKWKAVGKYLLWPSVKDK